MILSLLADFGAGLFLCNCLPHLCSGLRGEPFPSPFAKPPGKGNSSAVTNTLWGTLNLAVGLILLDAGPFGFGFNLASLVFFAGFLALGVPLARHFAAVRRG